MTFVPFLFTRLCRLPPCSEQERPRLCPLRSEKEHRHRNSSSASRSRNSAAAAATVEPSPDPPHRHRTVAGSATSPPPELPPHAAAASSAELPHVASPSLHEVAPARIRSLRAPPPSIPPIMRWRRRGFTPSMPLRRRRRSIPPRGCTGVDPLPPSPSAAAAATVPHEPARPVVPSVRRRRFLSPRAGAGTDPLFPRPSAADARRGPLAAPSSTPAERPLADARRRPLRSSSKRTLSAAAVPSDELLHRPVRSPPPQEQIAADS